MYKATVNGESRMFEDIRDAASWIDSQPKKGTSSTIEKVPDEHEEKR